MVDVEISLILLVVWRVNIGNYAVAVPLKVSYFRVFGHDTIYDAEYVVLNLRVRDVEYQLVAIVISLALRLHYHPVGMFFEEFAFGVYHFRLNPDAEFHSCLLSVSYQSWYTVKETNLMPGKDSELEYNGKQYSGDYLMKIGLNVFTAQDGTSHVLIFE